MKIFDFDNSSTKFFPCSPEDYWNVTSFSFCSDSVANPNAGPLTEGINAGLL
jgi:hypothetical protein